MSCFEPLTQLWEANSNFFNVKNMIAAGVEVPDFRFKALEDQFILKMTRVVEILRDYGDLKERPFDIRHMLEILKIPNWKNIPPFKYYLDPLEKALADVEAELLRMRKAGLLRSRYIVEKNEVLASLVRIMVEADITAQWLVGDLMRQDQFKFLYGVQRVIYESGLREFFLNEEKRAKSLAAVVPKLCTLMSMMNIMRIDNQKAIDKIKAVEKEKRKAYIMAETGIGFEPEPEVEVKEEEKKEKKGAKAKKVEEIDPEVLE